MEKEEVMKKEEVMHALVVEYYRHYMFYRMYEEEKEHVGDEAYSIACQNAESERYVLLSIQRIFSRFGFDRTSAYEEGEFEIAFLEFYEKMLPEERCRTSKFYNLLNEGKEDL